MDEEKAADDRLRAELAHLAPRENSEEGIPVLLACINLVGNTAPPPPTAFNRTVAAEFRRDAPAWERLKPNSPENDLGNLIQVFAYRDFAAGGVQPK